jgi:hypothetical protein
VLSKLQLSFLISTCKSRVSSSFFFVDTQEGRCCNIKGAKFLIPHIRTIVLNL